MGNIPASNETSARSAEKERVGRTGPVMLALSTFRLNKEAIKLAIEKAAKGKDLVLVYVVDVNLARYFIGTDIGLYPDLKKRCEEELLLEYEQKGKEIVTSIAKKAGDFGIAVRTYVSIGRFALECLKVIEKEEPEVVVTMRSKRPAWVKRFFGSPVDYLIAHAGCPVIEA